MKLCTVPKTVLVAYAKPGELKGNWKGGVITDDHGRVLIYARNHPHPNGQGVHIYRYRLVVVKNLGRFLCPDEVIHDINEDPSNDHLENLQVMTQCEHMRLHQQRRKKLAASAGTSERQKLKGLPQKGARRRKDF